MKRLFLAFGILLWLSLPAIAQQANYSKMSSLVRRLTVEHATRYHPSTTRNQVPSKDNIDVSPELCAFVQIDGNADSIMQVNGCRKLASFGHIFIASIPINRLSQLSLEKDVNRIEARQGNSLHMDSVAIELNTLPVYAGTSPLPQAFSGKGVVVGVQDVGFDLTHPNFYDATGQQYRIKRFWDQLAQQKPGSQLYVGDEYTTESELLHKAHSLDGLKQTHGTHTLGIAAGSGYNSAYRGMAYESDICLVSNAISADAELIDSANYSKYTYSTDALGFKYMMDYAQKMNQPCVISYSEGSNQDFSGEDVLYEQILDSLSGPGKIIVASAGNDGLQKTYFRKPVGVSSAGTFVYDSNGMAYLTMKSSSRYKIKLVAYGITEDSVVISSRQIPYNNGQILNDTVMLGGRQHVILAISYPSSYNASETVSDVLIKSNPDVGVSLPFSFEVQGNSADVEVYRGNGYWVTNSIRPALSAGECTHSVNSPSSAPSVICVGATSYRTSFTNYLGEKRLYNQGTNGIRGPYSSVGPTYDERIKPDVMAPGTNVISSYSSYYIEANPHASDVKSDVAHFLFNGRTYAWNCNSGTSMAAPVVAGAIALWLQAKPTLTRAEVMDVLSKTCSQYDTTLSYPNNYYGYGQIDVYKGLLNILGISGIEDISQNQPTAIRFDILNDGVVEIRFKQKPINPFSVNLYSTNGTLLTIQHYVKGQLSYRLDISNRPRGVYVIQVNGGTMSTTGSTLIRR